MGVGNCKAGDTLTFKRIPDFELDPAAVIRFEGGMVNCVTRVPIVWKVEANNSAAA